VTQRGNSAHYPAHMPRTPDEEASRTTKPPRARGRQTGSPVGKPSTARRELVEQKIVEHAIALFAERGFAATSLQDIADAAGLTRPALYHYVSSKEELLARLVRDFTEHPAALLREVNERTDLRPEAKLRLMLTDIARELVQFPDQFRLLVRSEGELQELSNSYQENRRQVLKELIRAIDAGIVDGSFRPVDPRVAALGIIGMLNWTAWWHTPGSAENDRAVVEQLTDMAVRSVLHDSEATQFDSGPARALATIRQNLEYLEKQFGAKK
jgi:AcrR family transcriptional regulator